jgi:hypothetical protein
MSSPRPLHRRDTDRGASGATTRFTASGSAFAQITSKHNDLRAAGAAASKSSVSIKGIVTHDRLDHSDLAVHPSAFVDEPDVVIHLHLHGRRYLGRRLRRKTMNDTLANGIQPVSQRDGTTSEERGADRGDHSVVRLAVESALLVWSDDRRLALFGANSGAMGCFALPRPLLRCLS